MMKHTGKLTGLFFIIYVFASAFCPVQAAEVSVGEAITAEDDLQVEQKAPVPEGIAVFGSNLFNGQFSRKKQPHFNPDYKVTIGDTISVKIWGALDHQLELAVDVQGNIFIPKVGTVTVAGVSNPGKSVVESEVESLVRGEIGSAIPQKCCRKAETTPAG